VVPAIAGTGCSAPVILLSRDIGFEYPAKASTLVAGFSDAGADRAAVLALLSEVAAINARLDTVLVLDRYEQLPRPLCVFVGTPSRRMPGSERRLTHLVCWRLDQVGQRLLAAARTSGTDDRDRARVSAAWLEQATTTWMPVMEARPEVTRRRDSASSAAWLSGKRVLILGCGALGAIAAEICVRAGAAEVTVADNGVVHPGILVRQPYEDADIGQYKASALAHHLNQIHGDGRVSALPQEIIGTVLTEELKASQFDLIIDATANAAVTSRLEYRRAQTRADWPAVLTMLVGHDARRGIVTLARRGASGAGRDILRKVGLAACGDQTRQLADVRDDFFAGPPQAEFFQPEPGCSDPTFTGSAAETVALAAHLTTAGLDMIASRAGGHVDQPMSAAVVRLSSHGRSGATSGTWRACWPSDAVVVDEAEGYEIRLSPPAIREMRAESARGARVRGRDIETGGMLLGEIDDACRCIWIDVAAGPPPDSRLSAWHFDHGIDGVQELVHHHQACSRGMTVFVGMWHTHPDHTAWPSPTDAVGMQHLLAPALQASPRALMIILGGAEQAWSGWLRDGHLPEIHARLVRHDPAATQRPSATPADHTKAAWPGGFGTSGRSGRERPIQQRWPAWIRALISWARPKEVQR
jgi:integrative and conjugative element protein (TIGR02256 family)